MTQAVVSPLEITMRILHTSDWHLGRLFHRVHLTDDQAHVLEQFVELAREERPDAVLIAGDLYDRAVPPPEAVELLDDVLTRLTAELGIPTFAIAGNHDSAERVGFGARLLAQRELHIAGTLGQAGVVTLKDAHGEVDFVSVPYAAPEVVRSAFGDETIRGHEAALRAQLAAIAATGSGRRRVAMAHAFVEGATTSESERPLTVGGTGSVDASVFEGFDYVALGHLHRPQQIAPGVRYSGSLLPYSFSEVGYEKSVSLVELDANGVVQVREIELAPRRRVRVLEGLFEELLAAAPSEDYLLVRLEDREPVLDAMARLRRRYPNTLLVERDKLASASGRSLSPGQDPRRMDTLDLFARFYRDVVGAEGEEEKILDEADRALVAEAIAAAREVRS